MTARLRRLGLHKLDSRGGLALSRSSDGALAEIAATIGCVSIGEWLALGAGALVAHVVGQYNYLLFHTGVEFFSACVCFNIFMILSSTSDISRNNFLAILGTAYVFVGATDILHALAFKGMPIFTDYDYYAPQLWIVARALEAGATLAGLLALGARFKVSVPVVFVLSLAVSAASLLAIFHFKSFPICFVPGEGLTPFKIVSECVIVCVDLVCLQLLSLKRGHFDLSVYRLLTLSLMLAVAMELCFSLYAAPWMDDALNEAGHIIKMFSFYILYKAIVVGSVRNPLMLVADELRDSEKRLRHATAAAGLSYAEIDLDRRQVRFGANFAEVMGYSPKAGGGLEAREAEFFAHVAPEDRARFLAWRGRLAGRGERGMELRLIGDDGGSRWIECAVNIQANGGSRRAFVTHLDITARVRARDALVAAKLEAERANQAKSHFLAAASHDLRQPVQALILYLSMIGRQVRDLPGAVDLVQRMKVALDGLSNLLTAILDISRLDAGVIDARIEPVDLGAVLARLSGEYAAKAAQAGLRLRVVAPRLCVLADEVLLERALRNLIENALRYTRKGGVVVGARRRGGAVRLDVIDTGVGVAPDRKDDIFMEFVQLDNPGREMDKGLGLGLAIVARLARLMNATVEVVSAPGRGSRFSLTLAAFFGSAPAKTITAPELNAPGVGRILIVEDNAIVREGLERMLRDWGYDTATAASGEEALALVGRGASFDAHMLDYSLGRGMNGLETARELARRAGADVPTVILTGDTAKERIAEIGASDADMLHKPVTAEQLKAALARLAARGARAAQ